MSKRKFYLVERVFGDFFVDSGEVVNEHFLVKFDPRLFEIHYRFESDNTFKDIIEQSIELRINIPELVDLILAKGDKKRSWDINLFVKENNHFMNVGYSRAQLVTTHIHRPLFRKNIGVEVLVKILESQMPFRSRLTNSIISVLRQARDARYLEMKIIWSWFALEWYIQSKAKLDELNGILDYPQDGSEKYRTTLKKILKKEVEAYLDRLNSSITESGNRSRLESDILEMRNRLSQNIFSPPILSFFDDLTSHFEDLLINIESILTDSDSVEFIEVLRKDWGTFKMETKMAKRGRDRFSHLSLKDGTMGNIREIDSVNRIFRFMSSVIAILIGAFTQSPNNYDDEVEDLELSELTQKQDELSMRPKLLKGEKVSIGDWTGDFVSEGVIIEDEDGFFLIDLKNPSSFIEGSGEKVFIPFTPIGGFADYRIKHHSSVFICTFETIDFSSKINKQAFSGVFKIRKWYAIQMCHIT